MFGTEVNHRRTTCEPEANHRRTNIQKSKNKCTCLSSCMFSVSVSESFMVCMLMLMTATGSGKRSMLLCPLSFADFKAEIYGIWIIRIRSTTHLLRMTIIIPWREHDPNVMFVGAKHLWTALWGYSLMDWAERLPIHNHNIMTSQYIW